MKKLIALVLALVWVLGLVGCNNNSQQEYESNAPLEHTNSMELGENKELLQLQYFPQLSLKQTEPNEEKVDLAYSGLSEIDKQSYTNNPELKVFVDYIEDKFGTKLDKNWNVFLRFFDEDKNEGILEFTYSIGDIGTDKSINFVLSGGKVDMLFYSHLDESVDAETLQNRVQLFETKYVQEQYQLKDGEKFVDETVYYAYYYDTSDLVYFYVVFFSDEDGIINNSYGTICFIDENGNAVFK